MTDELERMIHRSYQLNALVGLCEHGAANMIDCDKRAAENVAGNLVTVLGLTNEIADEIGDYLDRLEIESRRTRSRSAVVPPCVRGRPRGQPPAVGE